MKTVIIALVGFIFPRDYYDQICEKKCVPLCGDGHGYLCIVRTFDENIECKCNKQDSTEEVNHD